jgi:hypothetical protein
MITPKMSNNTINAIALFVNGVEMILAKGYKLFRYNIETKKATSFSHLVDPKNSFFASFKYTRRIFRAEITHLYHFQNDTWICIAKKGLFRYNKASGLFEKCCDIEKGSRPMNLCQGGDGTIYYGEYCYNPERNPMRIFQSKNNGDTWTVAYEFKKGEVNHIHGIFNDPYTGRLWVATGDSDAACVFGYTEDGFKTFVKKYSGSQQYRVCVPLFTKKEIIFATDSQFEQNFIRSINRITGEVTDIQPIQGSSIYAVQNGDLMMISTTVEPSEVNKDNYSHLWCSFDGHSWKEYVAFKKDVLPKTYFQFGSIRFPHYENESEYAVFSGRALKGFDGESMIIPIKELKK